MEGRQQDQYRIEQADLKRDREDIIDFWSKNFKGWMPGKYDQFYLDNPLGQAPCWIIREPLEGMVVAAYALFPRYTWVDGKRHIFGICGDMGADPHHRGHGLGRRLQQAAREFFDASDWRLLYGTANVLSRKVLAHEGFIFIGTSVRMSRVLNSRSVFERNSLLRIIAPLVAPIIDWVIVRRSAENNYANDERYQLISLDEFDERFDTLFKSAISRFRIIGDRGAAILNWRFARSPQKDFRIQALVEKGKDCIVGYVVFQVRDGVVLIEDIFALDSDQSLRRVLGHFILSLREADVAAINLSFYGATKYVDLLADFGFVIRDRERTFVMLISEESDLYPVVTDQQNWYFFHADNDVDA